jgi:hypothetical protein
MQFDRLFARFAPLAGVLISAASAYAQCPAEWQPGFNMPGVYARSAVVFDDGSGPALYVGGSVDTKCPVSKWDGVQWSGVGLWSSEWAYDVEPDALAVFDDGSGPALYMGSSYGVHRLVGGQWQRLPGGLSGCVCLAVFDDGNGPALYAGDEYPWGGPCLAKWDGSAWSDVGGGVTGMYRSVFAMAVWDDGTGPALYVTGEFSLAGGMSGIAVNNIAKWDGQSWSALGLGIQGWPFADGYALAVYDPAGPTGPGLYVGGNFAYAGTQPTASIARWDGQDWSALGSGLEDPLGPPGDCYSLSVYDDGAGQALFAGGTFRYVGGQACDSLAKWDGTVWTPFFCERGVRAQAIFDPPGPEQGPGLYLCGGIAVVEGLAAPGTVRLDGSGFSRVGEGLGPDSGTCAVRTWDDGSGPAVYVGGQFRTVGDIVARGLARWDGAGWSAVGELPVASAVYALATYAGADALAPGLYAGGRYSLEGGSERELDFVLHWDGSAWGRLGDGAPPMTARSLAIYDDGLGEALFVGGWSPASGFEDALFRWDGTSWSALEAGLCWNRVYALCVYDPPGPEGPGLYVAGYGESESGEWWPNLARWDGQSWSDVGGGVDGVRQMAVFGPSGTGQVAELYALGNGLTKWDGQCWEAVEVPGGLPQPRGDSPLAVLDLGSGPALYVSAGTAVLSWDGQTWTTVADGGGAVTGFAALAEPGGPALYLSGIGLVAAGSPTVTYFARWGCPPGFSLADLNCDGAVDTYDIDPFVIALVDPPLYASAFPDCYREAADCNGDGAVNVFDIDPFVEVLINH